MLPGGAFLVAGARIKTGLSATIALTILIRGDAINTVKFCENNLGAHQEMASLLDKAKIEFTNVEFTTEPCLGHCDTCAEKPIALANDELVSGDTGHLLFERIKNQIGEREVAMPNIRR